MSYDPIGATQTKRPSAGSPDQFDPRRGSGVAEQAVYKKSYKKKEDVNAQIQSKERSEIYRFPSDQNYPASISYSLRRVIPLQEEAVQALLKKGEELEKKVSGEEVENVSDDYAIGQQGEFSTDQPVGPDLKSRTEDKIESEGKTYYRDVQTDTFGMKTAAVTPQKQVILYFPQSVQYNDGVSYNQQALGSVGLAALTAARNGSTTVEAMGRAFQEGLKPLTDLLSGNLNDLSKQGTALAVSRIAAQTSGQGKLGTAASVGLQVKMNPNTRTVFQGVNIRNFTFTYDFIARSPDEANEIKNIIKFFRTELYPSTPLNIGTSGLPLGYKFPNLFEIKLRYNNSPNVNLPQPIFCYLRDVQTNYNPGSMSFHADGNPTQIQMTLNFSEYRALRREDVEAGA